MRVVDSWTGARADALRQAFRMTIEKFAEELGVSTRAVAYWRERPDIVQKPERQAILDTALERAPDLVKARFSMLANQDSSIADLRISDANLILARAPFGRGGGHVGGVGEADAKAVVAWLESTNTSDDAISYFAQTVSRTAEEHASAPPATLLARVHQLHSMIRALLQGGRQRQSQTTDLLRLDADLLAHLCQLLGDIHRDRDASAYALASMALANEAGTGSAAGWAVASRANGSAACKAA